MNRHKFSRLQACVVCLLIVAPAWATICYGLGQAVLYNWSEPPNGSGSKQLCRDLTEAPSGATYWMSCFYVYCNTNDTCPEGPNSHARKRFRQVWEKPDQYPYAFTKNGPTDVNYGCCVCNPAYTQTTPPNPD